MKQLTLLQMGDIHGHLLPRPNLRSDGAGGEEGGLARLYARIRQIRRTRPNVVLCNTGDTIQGSAEALYTRGQALVDVVDRFDVAAHVPGNWDYLYGKRRFLELFGPGTGPDARSRRWGAVAANVFDAETGDTLLPPFIVHEVAGIRIGFLGLSSERAISALGDWVTEGIRFAGNAKDLPRYVALLREERVDLIVLLSEFGLARNILIANDNPDIAIVLSSDMHEETRHPVIAASGAIVSEAGQDGIRLAQLDLTLDGGRIGHWDYRLHVIDCSIEADAGITALIDRIRKPFVDGPGFVPHTNPINGSVLATPIDTVIGQARIGLHRSNFSHETMLAAIEGSSTNFLADAIRERAGADVGHFRGFRYGTHVRPGPIRLEDIYHFIRVGPQIARTTISGRKLKNDIERSADGTFNPDPYQWTGGWLNAYAGLRFDLDVYRDRGHRVSNVMVQRAATTRWEALEPASDYTLAGYWYARDPQTVGGIATDSEVDVLAGSTGETLDATQAVVDYLQDHPADPALSRVAVASALPAPAYGNAEIQPLRGTAKDRASDD